MQEGGRAKGRRREGEEGIGACRREQGSVGRGGREEGREEGNLARVGKEEGERKGEWRKKEEGWRRRRRRRIVMRLSLSHHILYFIDISANNTAIY